MAVPVRPPEDCWFETVDGLRINGWYLAHRQPKVVILFSHGNAGNITHRAAMAAHLHKRFDASILLFDYRGYGRSEGTPTVEGLLRDAHAARDYLALRERMPLEDIVLMGRSLGGAVAVQLAADGGARALVLNGDVTGDTHLSGWFLNDPLEMAVPVHSPFITSDNPFSMRKNGRMMRAE